MLGTRPRTSRALETTAKPSPTRSNVTVALTFSDWGGLPARPSPPERAMAKQLACAAASSSSGLVTPLASGSERLGQLTSSCLNTPLVLPLTAPLPVGRSPLQVASARRTAAICFLPRSLPRQVGSY